MKVTTTPLALVSAAMLSACAYTPQGPTVQVLPGKNKSFDAFQADQARCNGAAAQSVQGQADRANTYGAGAAVLGTVLGAGLGAAIGGGRGAAVGAAGGALGGTAVGSGNSGGSQYGIQRQYNNAYASCMVAQGNLLPQPVYVQPQTVYVQPQTVYVQPQPYVVQPAPYVVQPQGYYGY